MQATQATFAVRPLLRAIGAPRNLRAPLVAHYCGLRAARGAAYAARALRGVGRYAAANGWQNTEF